jgi:hypothetical protein
MLFNSLIICIHIFKCRRIKTTITPNALLYRKTTLRKRYPYAMEPSKEKKRNRVQIRRRRDRRETGLSVLLLHFP